MFKVSSIQNVRAVKVRVVVFGRNGSLQRAGRGFLETRGGEEGRKPPGFAGATIETADDADTERDRWKVAIFSSPAVSFITFWYQRFSFFEISAAFQLCDCWRRAILRAILARRHPGSEPCIRADECAFSTGVANLLHSLK
jgi:hypothetical protein